MSVITYRRHSFVEPGPITLDQFLYLRQKIATSADFEIDGDFKATFTSQYKKNMRWFLIGGTVGVCAILVDKVFFDFVPGRFGWPGYLVIIGIIAGGAVALFTLVQILLEGPSMATTLTDRRRYFSRMKHAIRHYSDYPAFYASFYGDGKKNISGSNTPFLREALQEQRRRPATMDLFLTRTFYLIDQHLWKLVLVVIAIVFIKKYIIK